jgi:hypothetical protein
VAVRISSCVQGYLWFRFLLCRRSFRISFQRDDVPFGIVPYLGGVSATGCGADSLEPTRSVTLGHKYCEICRKDWRAGVHQYRRVYADKVRFIAVATPAFSRRRSSELLHSTAVPQEPCRDRCGSSTPAPKPPRSKSRRCEHSFLRPIPPPPDRNIPAVASAVR